jgi:hypothetical protein
MNVITDTVVKFVNNTHEIFAAYSLLVKYSKLIATLDVEGLDVEIAIPQFKPYTQFEVTTAFETIITALKGKTPTLKVPLMSITNNQLHYGITAVPGSVDNLILYLYIVVWLDIDIFLAELISTLKHTIPEVKGTIKYMNIVESVLRQPSLYLPFLTQIKLTFENNVEELPVSLDVNDPILKYLQFIMDNTQIELYSRYKLYINYALYPISPPQDTVDEITLRRLYQFRDQLNIDFSLISAEIKIVEDTFGSVLDSLNTYKNAMRVTYPHFPSRKGDGTDTNGYFMFQVQSKLTFDKVYVGNVNFEGVPYEVIVQCEPIIKTADFKSDSVMRNQNFDYGDYENYLKIYTDDIKDKMFEDSPRSYIFPLVISEDTSFRKWLDSKSLLSDFEVLMISKRDVMHSNFKRMLLLSAKLEKIKMDYYDVAYDIIGDETVSEANARISLEIAALITQDKEYKHELRKTMVDIYTLERDFYTSAEGLKLEASRSQLRCEYFGSESMYGGQTIVTNIYQFISIDKTTKQILLQIPSIPDVKLYSTVYIGNNLSFPEYYIQAKYGISTVTNKMEIVWDFASKYNDGTSLDLQYYKYNYTFLVVTIGNTTIGEYKILSQNDSYNILQKKYVILDPSRVNDLQKIIRETNLIYGDNRGIFTHPHGLPKLYLTYRREN